MGYVFSRSQQETRAEAFLKTLAELHQPAFAVDVNAAEVIAANADGAQALGLSARADFPLAIAPDTPALKTLRSLASQGAEVHETRVLTFSFVSVQRHLLCRIVRDAVMTEAGVMLAQVIECRAPDDMADINEKQAADAHLPPQPAAARPHGSDAETLKGIAHQILEGISSLTQARAGAENEAEAIPSARSPAGAAESAPRHDPLPTLSPQVLAKLAHELKTPLSAIAAAAEIMRDERIGPMGNDRYRGYAADIHDSASHALAVIAAMLRPEGQGEGAARAAEAIDLNALAERVVSTMQPLAAERRLRLALNAAKGRPSVVANATSLRQILLNLLTNAIKFTEPSGEVRVVTGHLDDGRVFLVVGDTGVGAVAGATGDAVAARPASRLGQGKGHGIGLALVRRLAEDIGASVEIDSVEGKGTVVLVVFGAAHR